MAALSSRSLIIGLSNCLLNLVWEYRYPGMIKSKMDQSSVRLFSIGVPVKANRASALMGFYHFGVLGVRVLYMLGFVQYTIPEGVFSKLIPIPPYKGIGGYDKIRPFYIL